jgi:hypothetical protein
VPDARKIIQQGTEERDQEGRHQEGEWVDIRDEDGIDGYSEHVLGLWTEVALLVPIFALEREPTRCIREWVIDGSQMDGTGDLKIVGHCAGIRHVYHRGSLCEGLRSASRRVFSMDVLIRWQLPRLSVTLKKLILNIYI